MLLSNGVVYELIFASIIKIYVSFIVTLAMRSASHYVSGLYTPRPDDTPRTRQQKEVRRKRVEYFETLSQTHIPSAKKESDREAGNTKLE